jgi:2-iminobutanoate/2-iminopropanoate deaminase
MRYLFRSGAVAALVIALSACSSTPTNKLGIPWWPNQPGAAEADAPGERPKASGDDSRPKDITAPPRFADANASDRSPVAAAESAGRVPAPVALATAAKSDGGSGNRYTQATRYGDLLYLSGQIAIDLHSNQFEGGTAGDQTRRILENVRQLLDENRLTMANIVSVTLYLRKLSDLEEVDPIYESYFKTALPARSVVEVAALPRGAFVEISVVAGR